jgi:hypothetical protein
LVGSIANGVENAADVSAGVMSVQLLPPSVDFWMSPPTYSS